MQRRHLFAIGVAVAVAACHDAATAPTALTADPQPTLQRAAPPRGTGLVIHNVTSTPIPLLGNAVFNGDLIITQLALTQVGGLQVSGTLIGTITGVGQTINQNFTTDILLSSNGSGSSCSVVTVDLSPINVNVAGKIVSVDLTQAAATVGAQGPLGNLLCALTSLLNSGAGGVVSALLRVINAILSGGLPTP
jgi:hypothetical protein